MFGEGPLDDRMDKGVLGAEVVIDRRDVCPGGAGDLPERGLQVVALGHQPLHGFDEPVRRRLARLARAAGQSRRRLHATDSIRRLTACPAGAYGLKQMLQSPDRGGGWARAAVNATFPFLRPPPTFLRR